MVTVRNPSILWAQRSHSSTKEKNFIYVTIIVPGIVHSTLNFSLTNAYITLNVEAKDDEQLCTYRLELEFYAEVDPNATKVENQAGDSINFVIFKKDLSVGHWPRLSNSSLEYVRPDVSQEIVEDRSPDGLCLIIVKPIKWLVITLVCAETVSFKIHRREASPEIFDQQRSRQSTLAVQADRPQWLLNLGTSYIMRYKQSGDLVDIECAISHFQQAVLLIPPGDPELPSRLNDLGISLMCRNDRAGDLADIDSAIHHLQRALSLTPVDHADLPSRHNSLGLCLRRRFEQSGDLADISSAISHQQKVVQLTSAGDADLPSRHNILGSCLMRRFERTADLADIDSAISHQQQAVKLTPVGHVGLPQYLNNLANSRAYRFECIGDLADINSAITHQQQSVDLIPAGHARLAACLNNLGKFFVCRYEHSGDMADIESAVCNYQQAVQLTPASHAELPICLTNLGISLKCRGECTGDLADMDSAISHLQQALNLTPAGHADFSSRLNSLGSCLRSRFERAGDLADIGSAISHQKEAVRLTPTTGHADLRAHLNNLGNSFACRFRHTGDMADIESAINHLQQAVSLSPTGHAGLPALLNNLGNSFGSRFSHTGDFTDSDSAISNHQKAVNLIHPGHAELPRFFNCLGISYLHRFVHTGELSWIDSAISHHQQAIELTPANHALLPTYLSELGNSFSRRFGHAGLLSDIDSAIYHLQKALHLTSDGHASLPFHLNSLGNSFLLRFERTRDLTDVDSAISYQQRAVNLTPAGHTNLAPYLNNLGYSFFRRFEHTRDLGDIDSAISHQQQAVKLTPNGDVSRPSHLNNLGNSFTHRFAYTKHQSDIDSAILHHQQAVHLTPVDHSDLSSRLSNLGNSFASRFSHIGVLADINMAIDHLQKAVNQTPIGHAELPSCLNSLGNSLKSRFEKQGNPTDINDAIAHYHRGALTSGPPYERLKCAKHAAMFSQKLDTLSSLPAFGLSLSLLEEVAGFEQTIHRRHLNISEHSNFVSRAVAAALDTGRSDLALEWLEQGRCLVWNQLDQLRTPVQHLRKTNPTMADKFEKSANMLEALGTRSDYIKRSSYVKLEDAIGFQEKTLLHTDTAANYKQALDEIRSLSGFEDFLRPSKAISILSSLPVDGPVILFNVHTERCDALALINGIDNPLHISLRDFSHEIAKALQETLQSETLNHRMGSNQARGAASDNSADSSVSLVLEVLWYKVVKPVVDALGYTIPVDKSDRPRIWWCPSGPLSFLPLHAAGVYSSRTQPVAVSDYVVSSYTPTVRSIKEKFMKKSAPSETAGLLLVCQPDTPGLPQIRSTIQETHELKTMMEEAGFRALLLEDSRATQEKVKEELNLHTWAHFACHGVQDPKQPIESGLCLHDGRLHLLEMMKQRITNPDLAFLSACQTGTGDFKLSEEVVHLSAGMLAAGYRGVVGTMWSISDEHGPKFAREFYRYILDRGGPRGMDSSLAAYALDHATTEVRKSLGSSNVAFLTWVPYVHFGY